MISSFSKRLITERSLLKSQQILPSVLGDPHFAKVRLLVSSDITATSDLSSIAASLTATGNTTASATEKKFGEKSIFFDGTGDWLTTPINGVYTIGAQDFCLEAWVNPQTSGTNRALWDCRGNGGGISGPYLQINSGNVLQGGCATGGATSNITGTTTLSAGTWVHVAWTRISGVNRLFLNGVQQGSNFSNSDSLTVTQLRFGADVGGGTLFTGYIDDIRFTLAEGRYSGTFVPPNALPAYPLAGTVLPDPFWTNTKLLITGAGTNNAANTPIVDSSSSAHAITLYGDAKQGTFSPFPPPPGSAYSASANIGSIYLDGAGDYLVTSASTDFLFDADFTIEMWVYVVSNGGTAHLYGTGTAGVKDQLNVSSGTLTYSTAGGSAVNGPASALTNGAWHHIAVTRASGSNRVFVDGVSGTPVTATGDAGSSSSALYCGLRVDGNNPLNGYISNLQVVKGTAKYTSNFAIPSAPVTLQANSKLLLDFNTTALRDETGKHVVTAVGHTKLKTDQFKYGGSSMYFDGSGDYLTLDGSSDFAFGTGDFTIEMWGYFPSFATLGMLIDFRPASTNGVYPTWYIQNSTTMYYLVSSANRITITHSIALNTWTHLALSRVSGVTRIFINGVLMNTGGWADTNSYLCGAGRPNIAANGDNTANGNFNCYLEDLRITKGIGRYSSNFTTPTQSLPRK